MGPSIRYIDGSRTKCLLYMHHTDAIRFEYDTDTPDAVVLIHVPSTAEWESTTKTALSKRQEVLQLVAQKVVNDYTVDGYFQIQESSIVIRQKQIQRSPLGAASIIGLILVTTGIVMLLSKTVLSGTYVAHRHGWTQGTLTGWAVIVIGLFFLFNEIFTTPKSNRS